MYRKGFRILSSLKRLIPLPQQARIAAALVPVGQRYRFALLISRLQGRLSAAMGGNGALTEALMRDYWLRDLTLHGPFPIPTRLHGREVLERYAGRGAVVYCWTHLPMTEIPLRSVLEAGFPAPAVVADVGRIVDHDKFVVFGWPERIPALPANMQVLARVRQVLLAGRPVVCLADSHFNGAPNVNPLRLAGRLHVPVVFSWAELAPDHVMDVTFCEPPHPFCEDEEAIAENLRFLREANHRVLRELGVTPQEPAPEPTATPPAGQLS